MTLQSSDTVVDRAERVKHSIAGAGDPKAVQVAVDGLCPADACDTRVVAEIHADTTRVTCPGCGGVFAVA